MEELHGKDTKIKEVTYKDVKYKRFAFIMDIVLVLFLIAFCIGNLMLIYYLRYNKEIINAVFGIIIILFGIFFFILIQCINKCISDYSTLKQTMFMFHAQKKVEDPNDEDSDDTLE